MHGIMIEEFICVICDGAYMADDNTTIQDCCPRCFARLGDVEPTKGKAMSEEMTPARESVVDTGPEYNQEVAPSGFHASAPELTEADIVRMENQVVLRRKAITALVRATSQHDWMKLKNKPYLQDSGVQKIRGVAGVKFSEPRVEEIDDNGARGYRCYLTGFWQGQPLSEVGTASAEDDFFKSQKNPKSGDMLKKSITNAQGRVLRKLLGLDGLTFEDLNKAGIEVGMIGAVAYDGGSKMATGGDGVGVLTKEKQEFWDTLLEINGGEVDAAESSLEEVLGVRDVKALTHAQVTKNLPLARARVLIIRKRDQDKSAKAFPLLALKDRIRQLEDLGGSIDVLPEELGEYDAGQLGEIGARVETLIHELEAVQGPSAQVEE
jgi:hypothetical protein